LFSQTDSSILNQHPQLSLLGNSASLFTLVLGCAELVFPKVITSRSVVEHPKILRIAYSVPATLLPQAESAASGQQESQGDKGSQDFTNRDRLQSNWMGEGWLAAYEMQIQDTVSSYTLEKCNTKKGKFCMCTCGRVYVHGQ